MKFSLTKFIERYAYHLMIVAAIVFATIAIVMLGGCTNAEKAAVRAVNGYCATFTESERVNVVRPRFNAAISPHRAVIVCNGDAQPTTTSE